MRTWAFISQKGGSGKSTLSTQLAVLATQCEERALIVDLDPQGSAEAWHAERGVDKRPGAVRCLPEKLNRVMVGAQDLGHTLLLVDTAPHSNHDALIAIRAADLIICPTQSSLFDIAAIEDTAMLLDNADCKHKAIVVVNCVPYGAGAVPTYEQARLAILKTGLKVSKNYICHRRPFLTSTNKGKGVTETHPNDEASNELRKLWNELLTISPMVKAAPLETTR